MKVIYKTSIVEKINEKIYEAKFINKEIDKIILSPDEEADLRKELQLLYPYNPPYSPDEPYIQGGQIVEFKGIQIFVERSTMKDLLNKLKAVFDENTTPLTYRIENMKKDIDGELALLDLGEKLDADLSYASFSDHIRLTDDMALRKTTFSGWYLVISFPCVPYKPSKDYPVDALNKLFEELKSFGAKHVDTVNHCLYFSLDENPEPARKVYKAYYDMSKEEEVLSKRIANAKEELRKLMEEYDGKI